MKKIVSVQEQTEGGWRVTYDNGITSSIVENGVGSQGVLSWIAEDNTPSPADPAPKPPTDSKIYDQTIKNNKVLKALVLALNDGSIMPGANVTSAALKAAIKVKM